MNGDSLDKQLPELSDEDIRVLDSICKRAARLKSPTYKSLYASYDTVLKEQGIEERHDNVLFRWLHSITDVVDRAKQDGVQLSIIDGFREILTAHGITVVDDEGEEERDAIAEETPARVPSGRRVSFDDARYEETWLSAHTQTLDVGTPEHNLLHAPPLRGRHGVINGHARAKSVPHGDTDFLGAWSSRRDLSQLDTQYPPDLVNGAFDLTETIPLDDLEDQADAAFDNKTARIARQQLSVLRHVLQTLHERQAQDAARARHHDFRVLATQVWDIWYVKAAFRRHKREDEARRVAAEAVLAEVELDIKQRVLSQWRARLFDAHKVRVFTRDKILALRYFGRWRSIAQDNAARMRSILIRKFFWRWHDLSLERRTDPQSVERICKRRLLRKHFNYIVQSKQHNDTQRHYEKDLQRKTLFRWHERTQFSRDRERRVSNTRCADTASLALRLFQRSVKSHQESYATATSVYNRKLLTRAFGTLCKQKLLLCRQHSFQNDVTIYTKHKAFAAWQDDFELARKASNWKRERILKTALLSWSDILRVRTMSLQIEDRIKGDYLYRLILEERSRLFHRNAAARLKGRMLTLLQTKVAQQTLIFDTQRATSSCNSKRRLLSSSFQRMHIVLRQREDAERAAVESANTRLLPRIITSWQQQGKQVQNLQKWAQDGQFFLSTKKHIKLWHTRAIASKQEKRRLAYEHIREKIKSRVARSCLATWRAKARIVTDNTGEAADLDTRRIASLAARAFAGMVMLTRNLSTQNQSAIDYDMTKLLQSGLLVLANRRGYLQQSEELAEAYKFEVDQIMLTTVLKRLRFAAFTTARLEDNSRMLNERLAQQHHRQMIRHLAATVKARQRTQTEDTEVLGRDPDSPSNRPASRAASRSGIGLSSAKRSLSRARGQQNPDTPAYLRTPARGRRARFRPIPTPAPYTPFAVTPGFLASTPAQSRTAADESVISDASTFTPQITPFARKLRAGGIGTEGNLASSLRRNVLSKSIGAGAMSTGKSVRFLGSGIKISRRAAQDDDLFEA